MKNADTKNPDKSANSRNAANSKIDKLNETQLTDPKAQPQQWLTPMPAQMQASSEATLKLASDWKQHVGAAKINWSLLTEIELLKTQGYAQELAALVQERYTISREIADEQVQKFIAGNK